MITLAALLRPEHVLLQPRATKREAAIEEVAALLEDDLRVLDWEELRRGLVASAACLVEQGAPFCICIPHARTAAVTSMVMSVGRFDAGLIMASEAPPVRYLFCIAVPPELATDYLRIIGLLARVAKDPRSEEELRIAATPEEFVEVLARSEVRL